MSKVNNLSEYKMISSKPVAYVGYCECGIDKDNMIDNHIMIYANGGNTSKCRNCGNVYKNQWNNNNEYFGVFESK